MQSYNYCMLFRVIKNCKVEKVWPIMHFCLSLLYIPFYDFITRILFHKWQHWTSQLVRNDFAFLFCICLLLDSQRGSTNLFLFSGNYALARKILMNIESNVPGLAMVCMRRISLERRNKNHDSAEELFKSYIEKAVSHKTKTFFSIKYARYLQKVCPDLISISILRGCGLISYFNVFQIDNEILLFVGCLQIFISFD